MKPVLLVMFRSGHTSPMYRYNTQEEAEAAASYIHRSENVETYVIPAVAFIVALPSDIPISTDTETAPQVAPQPPESPTQ